MSKVKKPSIPNPPKGLGQFGESVKMMLEILTGRRGGKVEKIINLNAQDVTAAPTANEHNTLIADTDILKDKLNELLDRIQENK